MQNMYKKLIILLVLIAPLFSFAQDTAPVAIEKNTYTQATIINQTTDENGLVLYPAKLSTGEIIEVNSFGEPLDIGTKVFLEYYPEDDNYVYLTVNRNSVLLYIFLLFMLVIIILAGKKGIRSFISLSISLGFLFFAFIPLLVQGFDPILLTLVFGFLVLVLSIFVTHGFSMQSLSAFIGSILSVISAILIIFFVIRFSSLTGFFDENMQQLAY